MPFRGTSSQRLDVWKGTRAKTSGGLTKSDLIRNKRGKIVSKKKSTQAASQNNLGEHLRPVGKKIPKGEMLHPKGKLAEKKAGGPKAKVAPKPKPAPKAAPKAAPKPKAPKPAAKPVAKPAPKPKPKPAQKAKPKKKPAQTKVFKKKPKINPLTNQAYEADAKSKISLDNVKRHKKRPKMDPFAGGW